MIRYAWQLLLEYFPTGLEFLSYGVPSVMLAFVYLYFAGYLKKHKGWRTGYTRKVFHFLVFFTASIVQIKLELTGTIVYGIAVSIAVFFAIYKGKGFILYEAMAREKDEPKQTYYIIMPYLATLLGGILSNILFTPVGAAFGYLATGFGDAVGEPFGTAFGKHKYKVPSLKGVSSYRSYEGSAAVFLAGFLAILIGVLLSSIVLAPIVLVKILVIAFAVTLVEAVSPHGWDNLTTQLVGSSLAFLWFL
ncbi:MAG: hypothetical protein R2753_12470 [Chitinophagales bacterium]